MIFPYTFVSKRGNRNQLATVESYKKVALLPNMLYCFRTLEGKIMISWAKSRVTTK